jgi:ribokinase
MENKQNIDFLSIGDVFNDIFIELENPQVTCDINHENCTISFPFGAKIPYKNSEDVLGVGNAGNAAVSASRLGLSSALLSFTGNDEDGKKIREYFGEQKISPIFIKIDPTLRTNKAYVLEYHPERTILVKQEAYPYTVPTELLDENKPKWIYLTSIGKQTLSFHHDLANWLKENPDVKLAFQPGTFQLQMGKDELGDVYKSTEVFFCNVEEAQLILKEKSRDLPTLLKAITNLGPKIVIITDGFDGAYAYDGTGMWFMPIYPHTPIERTGAGDAFASTVISYLAMGKTLEEALTRAPINSMSVTQLVGAQKGLLSREKLEEYLKKAPENFLLKKI